MKIKHRTFLRISGIGAPLLIIHGARDRVVPLRFGESLFNAAVEPTGRCSRRFIAEAIGITGPWVSGHRD